jgi:threonine dehydratase
VYALSVNLARRKVREVVASSTGNHGAAIADAAKLLGARATIFLPENPNPVKREKIAALGAKIVEHGADLMEGFGLASAYAQAHPDVFFLNEMLGAIRHLLCEEHVTTEPSGAAATAVLLQTNTDMRGNTVALVTGANVTPEVLRRAVNLLRGG